MSDVFPAAIGGFQPGARIAGYQLEEQIGHGGMAVVFRALDVRLDRLVALKILAPVVAADEAFRQRFMRESRLAAAVDDPHIIPVFEAGDSDGVLFIAMRLVRGGDVGSLVGREGPLAAGRVAALISPIASCLDAAHEAGLVHRDVKPANMLIDVRPGRPDHVYLSDFGLSKTALAGSGLTGTGQFLGTPDYVAPEQILGRTVDGRTDQYALAATAFELLSGGPPFRSDEQMAVIYAHLSSPPPSLTELRPDLPQAVDAVFTRALAKEPANRFGRCQDFADALRDALGVGGYDERRTTGEFDRSPGGFPPQTAGPAGPHAAGPHTAGPPTQAASPPPAAPAPAEARPAPVQPAPYAPQPTPQLTPCPASAAAPPGYVPPDRPRSGAGARTAAIVVAIIIAAAGIGTAAYLTRHSSGGHPSPSASTPGSAVASTVNWQLTPSMRTLLKLEGGVHANVIEGLAFSADRQALAVATYGGTYLVSVATGNEQGPLTDPDQKNVQAIAFSPDGAELATADRNGDVYLWPVRGGALPGQPEATLADPSSDGVYSVAFSPDGKTLAAGDKNGSTYLWNVGSGAGSSPPRALPDPSGLAVQAVAFSPDGRLLATGDSGGATCLWPVSSGASPATPAAELTGQGASGVQAVAFSPDGRTVAAGDASGATYLWPTAAIGSSSAPERVLNAPGGVAGQFGVVALAFSPDDRALASGGYDGQTYLWSFASGTLLRTLSVPGTGDPNVNIQAVEFGSGRTLAVGDTNGGAYLWTAG